MPVRKEDSDAHLKNVRTWFDAHAQKWSDLYKDVREVNDLVLINRKDVTVNCLAQRLPRGARVLDAGCGTGPVALDLARRGFFVHGVDIAEEMIGLCEENFAGQGIPPNQYQFTHADLLHMDLKDGAYDAAIALGVLQYQVAQEPMLRLFHRLVKPGGLVIVSGPAAYQIPNFFRVPEAGGRMLRKLGILRSPQPQGRTRYRYRVGRYRRVLHGFGFDDVEYMGHGFANWAVIGPWIGFSGELILHRTFTGLSKVLPITRWANDLVFVARRPGGPAAQ